MPRALPYVLLLALSGAEAPAQDAGLPEPKAELRTLDRAASGALSQKDAAALPRLRQEAARLDRRLDRLGPPAGADRAELNRLRQRLAPGAEAEEGAPVLPAPVPRRTRLITPALPETDLTLDDLGPPE